MDRIATPPTRVNQVTNPPRLRGLTIWRELSEKQRKHWCGFLAFTALLGLVYGKVLFLLVGFAAGADLHSHILLVPFITIYLIFLRRGQLPSALSSSHQWALVSLVLGVGAAIFGLRGQASVPPSSHHDFLTVMTFSFLLLFLAGGFFFLGRGWMRAMAFPLAFLFFMVPLPGWAVDGLETALKLASAEATALFFDWSGLPVLRDGLVFQLPGIVLEVAQECSGIRSTYVLFMTSLLASYLLLETPWRRALLVAVVIPLGIVRNGFRILVLGLLCVHIGPEMIHSAIHRRGGSLFFLLSLIPLFLLLWWLRRGDCRAKSVVQKGESR